MFGMLHFEKHFSTYNVLWKEYSKFNSFLTQAYDSNCYMTQKLKTKLKHEHVLHC